MSLFLLKKIFFYFIVLICIKNKINNIYEKIYIFKNKIFKMDLNKNYYKILELDKNASQDDIKAKYRNLAKKYHPDITKNKDDLKFKEISEAYSIIGDDNNKKRYDQQSPHGKEYNPYMGSFFRMNMGENNPFTSFGFDFEDLFGNIFNRKEEFPENLDINVNIDINLKDVYKNSNIPVKFKRNIMCPHCNFTGFDQDSEEVECDVCDGKGQTGHQKCKYCNGRGKINIGTCKVCNGEKVISKEEEFAFTNSYSIDDSFTKYLKGLGHQSKYYKNKVGTLIINVRYNHDNRYIKQGNNLIYILNLHYKKAIDGYEFEYEHLDDKKYSLKIPKRTKDGDLLRIPGKGLMDDRSKRGDLLIKINIIIDYDLIDKDSVKI